MRIVATIEARMASTRLPGKVLMPALGQPMLGHLVRRVRAVPAIDEIVLATTTDVADDALAAFADAAGIRCFRGSATDVMDRVIRAAESADADLVVELTGDCPLIDPALIERVISLFLGCDAVYATNAHIRSYPDGMDTQVFHKDTLRASAAMTSDPLEREHVTLHIRRHPELFPAVHDVAPDELHWPELGLTIDEPADLELITRIIEHFGAARPLFGCADVVRLLRANPDWLAINRSVRRKGDT